jgi:ComF family protein
MPFRDATLWLRRARHSAVDLLFPPACVYCRVELERGGEAMLCPRCRASLVDQESTPCPRCAAPLPAQLSRATDCVHCRTEKFAFAGVTALGTYAGDLQSAVLQMTRPFAEPLAMTLARVLADRVRARAGPLPDLAAPVPMHWLRRLTRGTNGAALLAEAAADRLGIAFLPDALVCRRLRPRQHKLMPAARRLNMRGAFTASKRYDLSGARVLVLDDVLTTGATAHTAAAALRKAGASEVWVAVAARGVGA